MRALLFALLTGFLCPALALQIPEPSGSDPRVGYVDYDPDEIVQITGLAGYQTTVTFAPDEVIEDLGSGFSEAWEIGPLKRENGFFIKMRDPTPNTNLAIVTNKRTYMFDLVIKGDKVQASKGKTEQGALPKFGQKFYYFIKFRYPTDERQKADVGKETRGIDEKLSTANRREYKNQEYWIQGTKELQPLAAWDDGRFTYLKFAPNTGFPAVFILDASDQESIVDKHVDDDTIVVHRVVRKLILRRDGKAVAVFNEAFDSFGRENATKTVSKEVRRVLKNGEEAKQVTPVEDQPSKSKQ